MTTTGSSIKRWMKANLADHIDTCNEVDCTGLAEAAAYHFDDVPDNGHIAEIYYDTAAELGSVAS